HHYQRALQTMELVDDPDRHHRAELLLSLADAWNRAGDVERARDAAWRSVALAREIDDPEQIGRAALLIGSLGYLGGGRAPVAIDRERRALPEGATDASGDCHPALRARLLARLAPEPAYPHERSPLAPLSRPAVALAPLAGD